MILKILLLTLALASSPQPSRAAQIKPVPISVPTQTQINFKNELEIYVAAEPKPNPPPTPNETFVPAHEPTPEPTPPTPPTTPSHTPAPTPPSTPPSNPTPPPRQPPGTSPPSNPNPPHSKNLFVKMMQFALNFMEKAYNEGIVTLITQTPEQFAWSIDAPVLWDIITGINDAMKGIGLGLLVLFSAIGIVRTTASYTDVKKPEHAVKLFIRFILAKTVVTRGMDLLTSLFTLGIGLINKAGSFSNLTASPDKFLLSQEFIDAMEAPGFLKNIPVFIIALIAMIVIIVLAVVAVTTVYGRFFKIYIYTAISPIPLSTFAGEPTQNVGKNFLKAYAALCLEGIVIALACLIYVNLMEAQPTFLTGFTTPGNETMTRAIASILIVIFNMLLFIGTIKISDRIIKEMMGL